MLQKEISDFQIRGRLGAEMRGMDGWMDGWMEGGRTRFKFVPSDVVKYVHNYVASGR